MVISITIPDAVKDRIINGVSSNCNYQTTINGQPNPESKAQFCKRIMVRFIKENVKAYEANQAANAAREAAMTSAETLDVG